ncbi:MAG: hypothetical protein ACXVHW_09380 [Methanobacterium sp.]
MDLKKWWDHRNNTDKAVIGLTTFCLFAVLYITITALLVPDVTFLSLDQYNLQIGSNPAQITVNGQTEPNARVFINSNALNLKEVPVQVSDNGSFEYVLNVPVEVSEAKVTVVSKAPKRYEISQDIGIQRPLTSLSINPINKIKYGDTGVEIEGQSEPYANITIVSNMTLRSNLNLQSYLDTALDDPVTNNITINTDSSGHFKQEFYMPLNCSSAFFNVTAKSAGKRESIQGQNITRNFEVFPPVYTIFDVGFVNNSQFNSYSGDNFTLNYPNVWQKRGYKNAGKDAQLYLLYGNSVECIVWHGQIGKEFGSSLDNYKQVQDNYLRSWWGATEVFEQNINYNDVKGIRVVYKCQQNPTFSNDVPSPFYLDRTTLTKNNKDVYELQLISEANYYEKNDYYIEDTVQSFNLK